MIAMQKERQLSRSLSPLGAWAFSIGTSVGWGSLVVTSNTYLAQAGPWGSVIGTLLGVFVMSLLKTGLPYVGLQANWQQIITGCVLIGAVMIDVIKRRRMAKEQ